MSDESDKAQPGRAVGKMIRSSSVELDITTKAHRKLKGIENYQSVKKCPEIVPRILEQIQLGPKEFPVGIYENVKDSLGECDVFSDESILFTDKGLHVNRRNNWDFIGYNDITSIDFDKEEERSNANNLILRLSSDIIVILTFKGRGKTYGTPDVNTFYYFLQSVVP